MTVIPDLASPRGVIVPLVTPFTKDSALDEPALRRLVDHVIKGGVDAIFLLGTTGEGPGLSREKQEDLVWKACARVAQRVPVYVGVTDTSLEESLRLTDVAAEAKATAAVIAPSPYFPSSASDQVAFFSAFADRSALPVILYNIPQMTKSPIHLEAFKALISHPRIVGFKDSSGNMVYFRRLQFLARERKEFSVLMGAEELLAESVLLGASGGVTGGANCFPELYQQIFAFAKRGDLSGIIPLQDQLMSLSCGMYAHESGGYIIQGLKVILKEMGICDPWVLPPLQPAGELLAEIARSMVSAFASRPPRFESS